jgi:hypothetical protein
MTSESPNRQELMDRFSQFPAEILAELLVEVILDSANKNTPAPIESENGHRLPEPCESFAHWLEIGIREYRFPELRRFRVEGTRVFLMFQNREIEIKPRMEALAEEVRPVLPRSSRTSGNANGEKSGAGATEPATRPDTGRFKNLEL